MNWTDFAPEFEASEFDEKTPGGEGTGEKFMDMEFVGKLHLMRKILGRPVVVTSGYRSEAHDAEVCRSAGKPVFRPNAHVNGHAADVACVGARERFEVVKAALAVGITRIGVDAKHVHLDDDPMLAPSVFWIE